LPYLMGQSKGRYWLLLDHPIGPDDDIGCC
jgi:hypothetical protein